MTSTGVAIKALILTSAEITSLRGQPNHFHANAAVAVLGPSVKVLLWALSWGECEGIAMGPILGRVCGLANDILLWAKQHQPQVQGHRPEHRWSQQRVKGHLSLVTPIILGVKPNPRHLAAETFQNMLTKGKYVVSTTSEGIIWSARHFICFPF